MDDKIIKKVEHLLSLAESDNTNEAENAMLKAQELLAKHKLTLRDIGMNDTVKIIECNTEVSFTRGKWKAKLASVIAKNFCCKVFLNTYKTNYIIFIGKEEDVLIAKKTLNLALKHISKNVSKLKYQYSKNGYSTKGVESDYALGFARGMSMKFEEQLEKNREWGLVLMVDPNVTDFYNNIGFSRTVSLPTNLHGHKNAYDEGCKNGYDFDGKEEREITCSLKLN